MPTTKSATKIAPPKAKRADWDAIERDYRTARFTFRELSAKHGADPSLISRKAKKLGWTQDLSVAIKQATASKLAAIKQQPTADELVDELSTKEVHRVEHGLQEVHKIVTSASDVNVAVILGHRHGLRSITEVKQQLLDQIRQAAIHMVDLAEVIEMVRNPDDNGIDRANDALKKAMGRSALVDDLKKLADVDEKVRKGEREAFGIESLADTPDAAKPKRITLEFVDVESRTL